MKTSRLFVKEFIRTQNEDRPFRVSTYPVKAAFGRWVHLYPVKASFECYLGIAPSDGSNVVAIVSLSDVLHD